MSIREVELVRRWFDAYGRGDRAGALRCVDDRFRLAEDGGVSDNMDRYRGGRGLELWLLDERPFGPTLLPTTFSRSAIAWLSCVETWGSSRAASR